MSRHWSARRHLALGLAQAMLNGLPQRRAVTERCVQALGHKPPWLPRLVSFALRTWVQRWHPARVASLADDLLVHAGATDLWPQTVPPIVRWVPCPPTMLPARLGDASLALPDVPTLGDLAAWLGLPQPRLLWLADPQLRNPRAPDGRLQHYTVRALAKRHGGFRLIEAPKADLRRIQRRLLDDLLSFVPPHAAAHGFRRRHSPLTHARLHAGQAIVVRLDLEDFFLSISRARVQALFQTLGYPPTVASVLAALCTTATAPAAFDAAVPAAGDAPQRQARWQWRQRQATPHLPQGAPTSPALANLCAFRLDLRLSALAEEAGFRYSRYADDLVLSGDSVLARRVGSIMALVTQIVMEEGFRLNHRKTHVMRRAVQQRVTGLVVNSRPNVPRAEYDRLKAILTNCLRQDPQTQNRKQHPDFRSHLAGRVAHMASIHPARAAKLRALHKAVAWPA
jgi:RNA-directed DNA polymerase